MANTGFDISPAALADVIVADTRPKLPMLDAFSTLLNVPAERGLTVECPLIAGDDAATFSKANGGYKETGDADITKCTVNLTHIHASRSFSPDELAAWGPEGIIAAFRAEASAKIVKKAHAIVGALVTSSNFSANVVSTAANFTYEDVVDLDADLDTALAADQRALVLSPSYMAALKKDAKLVASFNTSGENSVIRTGIVGQIGNFQVMQFTGLPGNSQNLVGFAAGADAIGVATAVPYSGPGANAAVSTLGGLPVKVEVEYTGGILYLTAAIRFGAGVGRATSLKRVLSA